MKQRRGIAGASALTVGWIVTGCLEVDPIIEDRRNGGVVDGGFARPDARTGSFPEQPEPPGPLCKDDGATFEPRSIPPAAPAVRACTFAQIQALAGACKIDDLASDPNTDVDCINVRAQNSACADCIFGNKGDPREKIVTLLPGEKPAMRVNASACIDHVTGIPGCGGDFVNIRECFDAFCELVAVGGTCFNDGEVTECVKQVRDQECKPFLITDQKCGEGIQNAKECFPASASPTAMRAFFEGAADIACGEKAVIRVTDGGS